MRWSAAGFNYRGMSMIKLSYDHGIVIEINSHDSPEIVAKKTDKAIEQYQNPIEGEFEVVKEAIRAEMSLIDAIKYWHVSKEQYADIKAMNNLSENEIHALDLNTLNSVQLSYLEHSNLVKRYPHSWSTQHNPDYYFEWTNEARESFDMNKVKILDTKNIKGDSVIITLPQLEQK